jgi:hypothetical protein
MEDRIRFIEHAGKQILLVDLSQCNSKELMILLSQIQATIAEHPKNSLRILGDFTGSSVDRTVATRIKEALVRDRPFVLRSAWVGTADLPKAFYENFKSFSQRDLPLFDTREQALEHLAKD